MAPPKQSTSGRAASALQAVAAVERKFGAGAVLRLDDVSTPTTDVLQTGLLDLDRTIGIDVRHLIAILSVCTGIPGTPAALAPAMDGGEFDTAQAFDPGA